MTDKKLITPILWALKYYNTIDSSRFHTPGHSGVNIDGGFYSVAPYDITELSFSDNLMCPEGVIYESEKLMAQLYGAENILYLTSGGTGGIFIALSILKNYGTTIIVDHNAHKSIYSAARTLGLDIIVIEPEKILDECDNNNDIAGVLITTPDYYGKVIDYSTLKNQLKKRQIIFVIDHCHGAHFIFNKSLPNSCVNDADIVICSLHKTLPVLTGGAMLAINNDKLLNYAHYFRMTLHSSSPSYLILASMDFARAYMQTYGIELYNMLYKRIDMIEDELSDTKYTVEPVDDRTRLVINCGGLSGYAVKEALEKLNIFPEMADNKSVIFILTPFNADRISQLIKGLHEINVKKLAESNINKIHKKRTNSIGEIEFIKIEDSLNRVAVNEISLYPPGIPMLYSGDIISKEILDLLIINRKHIIGLVKGLIPVLK